MFKAVLVDDVSKKFLIEAEKRGVKEPTLANYYFLFNKHIISNLPQNIKKIKEQHLSDFDLILNKKKISSKYKKDIIILFNSFMKFAKDNHYIKHDLKLKVPKVKKRQVEVLSYKEQEKLEDYLLKHFNYFNFGVILTLYTGIRIGELSDLKLEHLLEDRVEIRFTLERILDMASTSSKKTKIIEGTPKSDASIRDIPLSPFLRNCFHKLKYSGSYVLTNSKHFIEPNTIRRRFAKILKNAGISKKYTFHALRDTFATNCVEMGMSIKELSELLGHEDTKTTEKYYIYVRFEKKFKSMMSLSKEILERMPAINCNVVKC